MTITGWLQIALFGVIVILITRPFGGYMTRVFAGERTFLSPVLRPVERAVYWCCGVDENEEQHWLTYAVAMLFFSVVGFLTLYALQRLQWYLPFNPQEQTGVEQSLAFNTSVSFVTNTNWQSYVPETTMGYLVQMAGLTVHNFVSAATGIALALALIRGFARREAKAIGNFWVDLTRTTLYVLLPFSIVIGLFFVWQGMPQNIGPYVDATTLEGAKQTIAQGPVASQEVIKILGTNGGGFLNANSAHPYENPTPLTNLIQLISIFSIGAGADQCARPHGQRRAPGLGDIRRDGLAVPRRRDDRLLVRSARQSRLCRIQRRFSAERPQAGGNMEGKEVRFGSALPALFATVTTDTSCGAVNSMHDSFLPLAGWCRSSTFSWAR